jgi:hypothetical protein
MAFRSLQLLAAPLKSRVRPPGLGWLSAASNYWPPFEIPAFDLQVSHGFPQPPITGRPFEIPRSTSRSRMAFRSLQLLAAPLKSPRSTSRSRMAFRSLQSLGAADFALGQGVCGSVLRGRPQARVRWAACNQRRRRGCGGWRCGSPDAGSVEPVPLTLPLGEGVWLGGSDGGHWREYGGSLQSAAPPTRIWGGSMARRLGRRAQARVR